MHSIGLNVVATMLSVWRTQKLIQIYKVLVLELQSYKPPIQPHFVFLKISTDSYCSSGP